MRHAVLVIQAGQCAVLQGRMPCREKRLRPSLFPEARLLRLEQLLSPATAAGISQTHTPTAAAARQHEPPKHYNEGQPGLP